MQSISTLCDCDVAASTDDTGHASRGGDWDLEYAVGTIDVDIAPSIEMQRTWAHLLALETVRDSFNTVSGGHSKMPYLHEANLLLFCGRENRFRQRMF